MVYRRTVAEIQTKVAERSKQDAFSRIFKDDSRIIADWRMDLDRIVLIFRVSTLVFIWTALTVHSQTELEPDTYVTISDVQDDVAKAPTVVAGMHTVVSNLVRRNVAGTRAMVSKIHHRMLRGRADDQRRSAGDTRTIPTTKHRLASVHTQTRSATLTPTGSGLLCLHLVCLVNHLPLRRRPVLNVAS